MIDPRFEVSRINSMQWNRTVNGQIFSVLDDRNATQKSIPPEVLKKVQDLLQQELKSHACSELAKANDPKEHQVVVQVDIKTSK